MSSAGSCQRKPDVYDEQFPEVTPIARKTKRQKSATVANGGVPTLTGCCAALGSASVIRTMGESFPQAYVCVCVGTFCNGNYCSVRFALIVVRPLLMMDSTRDNPKRKHSRTRIIVRKDGGCSVVAVEKQQCDKGTSISGM